MSRVDLTSKESFYNSLISQSYNDLISSESNRELNQIQSEITKATQSSLGDVSVVGQKEHVSIEPPGGDNPMGGGGGIGGMGGLDGMEQQMSQEGGGGFGGGGGGGEASMKGAIDAQTLSMKSILKSIFYM